MFCNVSVMFCNSIECFILCFERAMFSGEDFLLSFSRKWTGEIQHSPHCPTVCYKKYTNTKIHKYTNTRAQKKYLMQNTNTHCPSVCYKQIKIEIETALMIIQNTKNSVMHPKQITSECWRNIFWGVQRCEQNFIMSRRCKIWSKRFAPWKKYILKLWVWGLWNIQLLWRYLGNPIFWTFVTSSRQV